MKLSDVIKVWDILRKKMLEVEQLGYCDLEEALESVLGPHKNDCKTLEEIQERHKLEQELIDDRERLQSPQQVQW